MEKMKLTTFEVPVTFFLDEDQKKLARKLLNSYYWENGLSEEDLLEAHYKMNASKLQMLNLDFYNDGSYNLIEKS
jgi:hypothetical protein